jgi:hypothetical protein
MRTRVATLLLVTFAALGPAPVALATTRAGEGLDGGTSDVLSTNWMFGVMVFFAVIIVVFSLLQAWLDHRKHARMDAAKRRAASIDWRGGW